MVFELAGDAAFDGPMPGIMHSRRHFIGDQAALDHEKLDGEDTDIVECLHYALHVGSRGGLEQAVCKRCNAVMQDPAAVSVRRQRIKHDLPCRGARPDDGDFARELLKSLVDQTWGPD